MSLTSCLTTLQVEVCKFNCGVSTGHHSLTSYHSVINPRCCDNCTAASLQFEPSSRFTPPTKMENMLDSESDTDTQLDMKKVSRRAQQHLQNVHATLVSWRLKTATHDFPFLSFTSAVILPDPILTSIASNSCLATSHNLETFLSVKWAFLERYGDEILSLVRVMDDKDSHQCETKKLAEQEAKCLEVEPRAAEKVAKVKKNRCSCLVHHTKENCAIPGTGWYFFHSSPKLLNSFANFSVDPFSFDLQDLKLPMPGTSNHLLACSPAAHSTRYVPSHAHVPLDDFLESSVMQSRSQPL